MSARPAIEEKPLATDKGRVVSVVRVSELPSAFAPNPSLIQSAYHYLPFCLLSWQEVRCVLVEGICVRVERDRNG